MKKIITIAIAAMLTAATASASTVWTMQGKTYNVDTLYHAKIGPGTTQTSLQLSGAQSLRVFYTTTDLTNPYVDIRVVKSGNQFTSVSTPETQQKLRDRNGARYFAGTNADFFANSAPCGSTVVDGQVYNATGNTWVNWYMTDDKRPHIATLGYTGTCTFADGSSHIVNGINGSRGENGLNIYDRAHNGSTTGTNKYGCEVVIEPIDGATVGFTGGGRFRVVGSPVWGVGSMAVPEGKYVLSGHGTSSTTTYAGNMINKLNDGDIITIQLYPSLGDQKITQMASGQPAILGNGAVLETQTALDHLTALNPRTAIGYNADGTRLVLMVVDGRGMGGSAGVVSKVLAELMLNAGCTEAMNFDGGGSSALYTTAFGYRNKPSDGTPRACTNTVWCVSTGPDDNTVAEIAFADHSINLPRYGQYTPTIYGYNKYGALVSTNLKGVTLSCDKALGTVVGGGGVLLASGSGTHALTATYNGITAKAPVTISDAAPQMRLANGVLVDSYRDYVAEVVAQVGDAMMPLENSALTWSTDNAAVATVDETGCVHGVANGTATITASVGDFAGSLPVTVEIPATRRIAIVPDASTTVTKSNLSNADIAVGTAPEFTLAYTVKTTRSPKATINFKRNMYALPDSVQMIINPGDASIKTISFTCQAPGQRAVTYNITPTLTPNVDNAINVDMAEFIETEDFANYPVALNSVAFTVSDAANTSRTLTIKHLAGVYTAVDETGGVDDIICDDAQAESANGTAVYFNLQGQAVTPDAPGIYIRRQGAKATKVLVR